MKVPDVIPHITDTIGRESIAPWSPEQTDVIAGLQSGAISDILMPNGATDALTHTRGDHIMKSSLLAIVASVGALASAVNADILVFFDENGGGGEPRGLFNLDTDTGVRTLRTTVGGSQRFFGMAVQPATGLVYAVSVPGNPTGLWTIDIDTGATSMVASIGLDTIADITFDPATGEMYGQERNGTYRIFKIDPNTGIATLVGEPGAEARCGLTFAPNGDLFAFSIGGELYSIDKNTGAATLIGGPTGISVVEDGTVTRSGQLYITAWEGAIYRVDSSTGSRVLIHATGMGSGCLAIIEEPGPAGCYADCDTQTGPGVLDIFDFLCFGNRFSAGDPYACDCDTQTGVGVCDIFDFLCFGNAFNAGCP